MKNLLIFIFALSTGAILGQQVAKSTSGEFILKNATLHTIANGTITGDLWIKDGKIASIGDDLSSASANMIDCTGKHVYPGFIDAGTRLGLSEIGAVSLTQDYNELGDFIPHMQALSAVNPNSVSIPVTRVNGVTTVIAKPDGGLFPGTAALIHLHGYTPEQMFAGFKGVVMNFPASGRRHRWDRRSDDEIAEAEKKAMEKLDDIWEKALLYHRIDSTATALNKNRDDYNPQMDALLPVVRGERMLMVEANKKKDILNALTWLQEKKIDNAVLTGVAEGYRVVDKIKDSGYAVITGPVLSVPNRDAAKYDVNYKNPSVMHKAGIPVALRTDEAENVRNLPFNAGFAAAYGMGKEEALAAITLVPAKIFGLQDKIGSLETGKLANLFISDGDPFEMKTTIERLFIGGYDVPLESRHTLLYDEFLERDPGLK